MFFQETMANNTFVDTVVFQFAEGEDGPTQAERQRQHTRRHGEGNALPSAALKKKLSPHQREQKAKSSSLLTSLHLCATNCEFSFISP